MNKPRTIHVAIPGDLHGKVLGTKATLGKRWPEVVEEALRLWLAKAGRKGVR